MNFSVYAMAKKGMQPIVEIFSPLNDDKIAACLAQYNPLFSRSEWTLKVPQSMLVLVNLDDLVQLCVHISIVMQQGHQLERT